MRIRVSRGIAPTEKSPASSSREHNVTLNTDKLRDAVAQACLSVVRMSRVVEKAHNSKTSEAWLVRQHLEKASIEAVDSMKDEIQGAHTSADMWRVEKKIGAQVSRVRVKAYHDLAQHHNLVSDDLTGQGGSSTGSSEIAEAEENFCKSVSNLVSTVVTEGAKVSGECGAALISSILHLVPNFPLSPVLTPTIDLPMGMECRIILGDAPQSISAGQHIVSSLPSSPLTGGSRHSHSGWELNHQVRPGRDLARCVHATRLSLLQTTCEHPYIDTPEGVWNSISTQFSLVEGVQCVPLRISLNPQLFCQWSSMWLTMTRHLFLTNRTCPT